MIGQGGRPNPSLSVPMVPFMRSSARLVLLSCACALVSACGGGGGGGMSPAPAAAPPAPATPLAMTGAAITWQIIRFSTSTGTPSAPGAVTVTITDPDVAAPTRLDQINFDGDETIQIQVPPSTAPATYAPAQLTAGSTSSWSVTTPTASGSVSASLKILSGPTRYVRMANFGSATDNGGVGNGRTDGYAAFGVPATSADMPLTGSARFTGLSYGSLDARPVTVDVNFAAATLSGSINTAADSTQVTFTAPISGANFEGTAAYRDVNGTQAGKVSGSFFGPGAAELGGVYSVPFSGPYGGFVAAR